MRPYLQRLALLFLAYYATARLGLIFGTIQNSVSPMWPPSGVALAAMLWGGRSLWPAVALGSIAASTHAGMAFVPAVGIAVSATAQAWIGAQLTGFAAPGLMQMGKPRDFLSFLLVAALPAAALGAVIGVGVMAATGLMPSAKMAAALATWVSGDWMGVVVVAPAILAWSDDQRLDWSSRWGEMLTLLVLLLVATVLGFESVLAGQVSGVAVRWLSFPLVAWAAVRFGLRGASASVLLVATISTWATVHGHGPFGQEAPLSASWRLAAYLAVTAGTAYVIAFLSAAREMTLRTIEEGRARLQGVVGTAMDAIITMDESERIRAFNPAAERLFGWRAEELLGHPVEVLIPERLRAAHKRGFEAFRASGAVSRELTHGRPLQALRRDGAEFAAEATVSQFVAGGGRLFTIIMRDVSARLAAEAALRASDQRFDGILQALGDIVWSVRLPDQEMIYLSAAVEEIYGRERLSFMRDHAQWDASVHPEDRDTVRAGLKRLFVEGRASAEHRVVRPDGGIRWVRVRMSLQRDESGTPTRIDGVSTDITRTRDLESQLRESQKMEAIGTLAGGIAHDFNNILMAIAGNAELLRADASLSRGGKEEAEEILRAARRARDLAQQILTFSRRREPAGHRAVDVADVVREALRLLRPTLPAGVAIEHTVPEHAWVRGDASQLHQIVTNLCTNAWQAMREGGTLRLSLEAVPDAAGREHGAPPSSEGFALLRVSDTGPGMTEEVRRRVFEPFFTTKAPGEGSGLGLAVVHGIVAEHLGAIRVHSEPGQGTEFAVYLPIAPAPSVTRRPSPVPGPTHVGQGRRLLLVEDEPAVRRVMTRGLEMRGFIIEGHGTPAEAMTALEDSVPGRFVAMITDLSMPGMNGVELARHARSRDPQMLVVLYSGDISSVREAAREAGIAEVLEKPVSIEELSVTLTRLLDDGSGES